MSIKPLNKETVKLINSTQVISSIFSAIKELVENSLDAQAQNIEINLVDNGLSLIEVKDNGTGICREDAQFMALPAYTSKISDFNDLDLLSTYGFRGEGLSAICQVADIKISTKTANDETMICYTLNNEGHVIETELSHGSTGTTVQMKNIFKNMPVRRNILNNKKKINQEIKSIEVLLKSYAICKPSVRFLFRLNSNTIFTKSSCKSIIEAIKSVLGIQIFSKLIHLKTNLLQNEIQLWIPKKSIKDFTEVCQVGLQFLCVNDRPIKSKEIEKKINKRISEYFNENTSNTRKFIFCLILTVDPSVLDVNLEPNKDKVFLQNEASILAEIDKSLLNYYELQDSQMSTQNDIENIKDIGNLNELEKENEKEKEKEWPACKKRKFSSQVEKISKVNGIDESKTIPIDKSNSKKSVKVSENDFLERLSGPILSDSDSNDADESTKKLLNKDNQSVLMDIQETADEDSEFFDFPKDNPIKDAVIEESLSQLPMVDLGEDFDWQEVVNKSNKTTPIESKSIRAANKQEITDIKWSKGQLTGVQDNIIAGLPNNVNNNKNQERNSHEIKEETDTTEQQEQSESFDFLQDIGKINDSDQLVSADNTSIVEAKDLNWDLTIKNSKRKTPLKQNNNNKQITPESSKRTKKSLNTHQTKIPFAGDNACLTGMGPSAFAMYCAKARTKILKEHPEFTPPEVAAYLNKQWKEIPSEEREYYRNLANQHNQSINNSTVIQPSKKVKSQPTETEKETNKKQFVNMLENMKMNKSQAKHGSTIMRSFVPWNISLSLIHEKFNKPVEKLEKSIVGSLNSLLWIINLMPNLFVFDITEVHAQLNIKNYDISQINAEYVKDLIDQWFKEKNDMSIFHPLYSYKT